MLYLFLADLLVLLHAAFVVFVVLGIFLVLHSPRLAWIHLPSALWGVLIEFAGWGCPLTPLENRFRQLGGGAGYTGGFLEHYLLPILYPQALTRQVQIALGMLVLIVNATGYFILWRRRTSGPL